MFYQRLYKSILFPFYDRFIKRRNIYRYYEQISGNPSLGLEELDRMRSEKLQKLVAYCQANVPFYRKLFRERNIDAEKVNHIDILRDNGIGTSKEILKRHADDLLSEQYDKSKLVKKLSSGTTGTPTAVYVTYDNWCLQMAVKFRSESWIGKEIGTPTTYLWGHPGEENFLKRIKKKLYFMFQHYHYLSAMNLDEETLRGYVKSIKLFGSRFLESYVSAAYLMAKVIDKFRLEPPRLDGVIIGAERLLDFQREQIQESFQCPVYNRYGCSEFMNISCECERQEGQHINYDNLWVEVVDEDDNPVWEEEGDIVVTDLNNRSMPLIRYRIGDRGVMTRRRCSCGSSFPLLREVAGRSSETIKTRRGPEYTSIYLAWKFRDIPGVFRYQVVQRNLDRLDILVEHDGTVSAGLTREKVLDSLSELRENGLDIEIRFREEIPAGEGGKTRFFVSEIS